MNKATLYLIHGFIAFGKTTFAKKLAVEKDAVRFTHDEVMIERFGTNPPADKFQEYSQIVTNEIIVKAKRRLSEGNSVILDFGFWSRNERDKYKELAKSIGADCVIYSINCDIDVAKQRCLQRTAEMPDGALVIDENAFNILLQKFEPINEDEEAVVENG